MANGAKAVDRAHPRNDTALMLENTGATKVRFTPAEITELNSAVRAIEIRRQRLPDAVLVFSGVVAPPKK